ncbi:RNA polymerase sigma factor [Tenuibacillus multivorans]|uniref:RNA polymerase sigma-70 factor, ECF subfamily n=1 Tax=Tenuibacillus multivorans TaxID=237069 RepID=A0A1H0AXV7_9BACI|nr:RNA polymerase sigma factor [Tenuibacillus multivorans]GEL77620.1 RNA polymerase sigma factor YlaC [Tenuibacillus multivorans]SDN38265.1 RNA polymerase sigma-70 factor, ECF subfamily [Tenuibacillus multivorans]
MNGKAKQQINQWYHAYSQDLFQYIFYLIRDHDQAKDLLQDTFLKAYNKHDSFNQENTKGWLFRIARNVTIDYVRKHHPVSYLMDTLPANQNSDNTPEKHLALSESEQELYYALGQLKRSYRDVIVLRKIKDFTVSETAEILGWKEQKVRVTLSRAIQALKQQLKKEGYQHEAL